MSLEQKFSSGDLQEYTEFAFLVTAKNSVILPDFLMWKFCGKAHFPIVSGDSPDTVRKLPLSEKFPHQEIRWNYGIFRSECFKNGVPGRLEIVHCKCFFLTQTRNMFAGKSVKWVMFLVVLLDIFYNVEWTEYRKMNKVLWAKVYCKMRDLFC